MEEFKAFKSLEAYDKFICGWVKSIGCIEVNGLSVLLGKVQHSQRLNEKPLEAWIVSKKRWHHYCRSLLLCSRFERILLSCWGHALLDTRHIQRMEARTVTDVPAYWVGPSSRAIKFSRVQQIDFCTPMKKKQKRDEALAEIAKGSSSAILSMEDPFYKIHSSNTVYPKDLSNLFDESLMDMDASIPAKEGP
ncbi:hypothetical protein JTE90_016837 [Oedothorax gibbosus]|uniref:Uncharacterized protein n=1 Tax=Oedothorax gibbosus TaxID=931172 RepID=A0AAV6W0K2_9ARAC|nr:hypothetical protein JTE90_016837 [Oedothorax gibbosus]